MYSTVKQCHVAIDYELQQINSNRKQAIDPHYYDIALNEAVLQFIETRSSSKQNIKREGFEESQKRYDDLKDLKRQIGLACRKGDASINNYKAFAILPGDYLKMIPSEVAIAYNKQGITPTLTDTTNTVKLYNLNQITYPFTGSIKVGIGSKQVDITNYIQTVKTDNGKFYAINIIVDTLRQLGYNVFYEDYDGTYLHNTLFIDTPNIPITGINYTTLSTTVQSITNSFTRHTSLELVSTSDVRTILDNYHASRNRHNNPICELIGDRLNVYYNANFVPVSVVFNYIKKPRLIDYISNTMCEITVPQEVIKLAVLHLKGILKDEGYNISANEKIINE